MSLEGGEAGQVFIHIGWHKSASTFLQQGLFRQLGANFQPLAAFPPAVAGRVGKLPALIDLVEKREGFDPPLLREAVSADQPLTIISHEEISGHSHGYGLIDPFVSARNLHAAFPNGKIIAVVRNQFDYLLSLYCYRVSIRGHEPRTLNRFLREDGAAGLDRHIQYDRLIGEYVKLFGAKNVLVLPMEQLRGDEAGFVRRITDFMGLQPPAAPGVRSPNESTRLAVAIGIWRPLNIVFGLLLKTLLVLSGKRLADVAPQKLKIYPLLPLRYRYYAFKRAMTARLNRRFAKGRKLDVTDIGDRERLEALFAESNARLKALGVIDWDMAAYGYPLKA